VAAAVAVAVVAAAAAAAAVAAVAAAVAAVAAVVAVAAAAEVTRSRAAKMIAGRRKAGSQTRSVATTNYGGHLWLAAPLVRPLVLFWSAFIPPFVSFWAPIKLAVYNTIRNSSL
jgi:hypothetical protein